VCCVIQHGLSGQSAALLRVKHKLHTILTLNDVSCNMTKVICRFAEGDVAMMLTLLQSCGLQLRSDDSVSMKVCSVDMRIHACIISMAAAGLNGVG